MVIRTKLLIKNILPTFTFIYATHCQQINKKVVGTNKQQFNAFNLKCLQLLSLLTFFKKQFDDLKNFWITPAAMKFVHGDLLLQFHIAFLMLSLKEQMYTLICEKIYNYFISHLCINHFRNTRTLVGFCFNINFIFLIVSSKRHIITNCNKKYYLYLIQISIGEYRYIQKGYKRVLYFCDIST